jgi:hypothetical protein
MRALLIVLLLAACGNTADGMPSRQVSILWPQGHRLYVADNRQGVVRAFATDDGPRAAAEGRAPGRAAVLDMKLDAARRRLWVLGPRAIDVHDANSLHLLRRYPVTGVSAAVSRLSVDDQGEARVVVAPSTAGQ